MYLAFRYHDMPPSAYLSLPPGERAVIDAFLLQEHDPKIMERIRWQAESARLRREEMTGDA